MNKGTHLHQNIMSMKYMSEFGVDYSFSNLILFHPKSTVSDVKETKRVLEHISHLTLPQCTSFALEPGSPLYYEIPLEQRKQLITMAPKHWPDKVKSFFASGRYNSLEEFDVSQEVTDAWSEFYLWYVEFLKKAKPNSLKQEDIEDGKILITDERSGIFTSHVLSAKEAGVYNLLHTPMTYQELVSNLGKRENLETQINSWLEKKIVINAAGVLLALALRVNKKN
jgi:flavodoxin